MKRMNTRPDDNSNRNWSAYEWDSHIGNTSPMRPVQPPAAQQPPVSPRYPTQTYPLNQRPPEAYSRPAGYAQPDPYADDAEFFYGRAP